MMPAANDTKPRLSTQTSTLWLRPCLSRSEMMDWMCPSLKTLITSGLSTSAHCRTSRTPVNTGRSQTVGDRSSGLNRQLNGFKSNWPAEDSSWSSLLISQSTEAEKRAQLLRFPLSKAAVAFWKSKMREECCFSDPAFLLKINAKC